MPTRVWAGNAVADVVVARVDPGGKLPVSFPQRLGQVPTWNNHLPTGRPCDATQKYDSRDRDLRSCDPGEIDVYAGDSSQVTMKGTFTVTGRR